MIKSIFLTCLSVLLFVTSCTSTQPGIIYSNPRVYNVDYTFEMTPDPNNIDRTKDLKVWIPIPREWDSQKAVKIISVQPKPHAEYTDPEHGNQMLFWDFGKEPEMSSYKVDIKFHLESYEVYVEVDPEHIEPYDKTNKEYALYTRSTHTTSIIPKIKDLAQIAVGDEKNVYLQAKRIFEFVRKKMRYKIVKHERGSGTESLLDFPVTDPNTGEQYFEGQCNHYSVFFVALCRAIGIPARGVNGMIGWGPWIKEEDLTLRSKYQTELTPDGLAANRLYGPMGGHIWAEFYLPEYGWIPVDPTSGRFGNQNNYRLILSKGRDVKIGPNAPQEASEGYGEQWIPLHNGRVDVTVSGAWNIAKIRIAKVKILHNSDPFPADGLAGYGKNTFPEEDVEKNLRNWRKGVLGLHSLSRGLLPENLNSEQFYNDNPDAKEKREAFVCHILRKQLGDEKFFKLVDRYIKLRQKSGQAVPTSRFQKLAEDIYGQSLDWFFNQWVNSTELPRLKLEEVTAQKDKKGWQVHGYLLQSGDTTFRLPIELAIDTKNGIEMQKIWIESEVTDFEFITQNEPQKLIVDPNYEVLKIQKMPPRLEWFWNIYPKLIVIYGTLAETEANKKAAERFNSDYLGLGTEIIKADVDVNEADLKTKCLVLFGRPETNKIAQRLKDSFPIKFDGGKLTWHGITYDKPTEGVAQVIDSPLDSKGLMVMYAGLSPEATQKFCDLYLYDADASYLIFGGDKEYLRGDWEDFDSDLIWDFGKNTSHSKL